MLLLFEVIKKGNKKLFDSILYKSHYPYYIKRILSHEYLNVNPFSVKCLSKLF